MKQARNAWTHRLTAAISGTIPRLGHFRVAMPGMLLQPARVRFIQIGSICKWFCGIHFNGLDKLMTREDCTHHAHFWIFFGSVISDTGFILAQKCSLSRFQANDSQRGFVGRGVSKCFRSTSRVRLMPMLHPGKLRTASRKKDVVFTKLLAPTNIRQLYIIYIYIHIHE